MQSLDFRQSPYKDYLAWRERDFNAKDLFSKMPDFDNHLEEGCLTIEGGIKNWFLGDLLQTAFLKEDLNEIRITGLKTSPDLTIFSDLLSNGVLTISRQQFMQVPSFWLNRPMTEPLWESWVETNGFKHPKRARKPKGVLYSRYFAKNSLSVKFRTLDIETDLVHFNKWQNSQRVADLWELTGAKEEHREYLHKSEKDPHQISLILEINNEPAGYFEVYWAREDRISPFCDSQPFDRGFHFLIGEDKFLGRERTSKVLLSMTHFLFLDDCRTRRIVAEPRSDNQAVIKYVEILPGWKFIKEFDFPHKRSALLTVQREDFFAEGVQR